jgi:hypothetical protein
MIDESGGKPWMPVAHRLRRDSYGRLNFTDESGHVHVGVVPVQAFPIDSPGEHISLLSVDGHELVFIEQLSALDADVRQVVQEEIAQREFLPLIRKLLSVSTFSTPSSWNVETDRGMNVLVLKGEEDIRRLKEGGLLITDSYGVTYRIHDVRALDRGSRKLLDRFL